MVSIVDIAIFGTSFISYLGLSRLKFVFWEIFREFWVFFIIILSSLFKVIERKKLIITLISIIILIFTISIFWFAPDLFLFLTLPLFPRNSRLHIITSPWPILHTLAPFLLDHFLLQLRRLVNKHSFGHPQLLCRLNSFPDDKFVRSLAGMSHLFRPSLIPLSTAIV